MDLGAGSCQSEGFDGGTLSCDSECRYVTDGCGMAPADQPVLTLVFHAIKQFEFSGEAVTGAEYYQPEQSPAPGEPFVPLGEDIVETSASYAMPLHFRGEARYRLRACNAGGCSESEIGEIAGSPSLADAVGYIKASNSLDSPGAVYLY